MLLNLKTDLKSLKYGKDRPGGGDSGQPYIQSDINSNIQTIGVNDDGRIRGGATGAKNTSTTDLLRIKRFINSKPKGSLFLTNQIGLQFSNPRLETRKISLGNGTGILGFINRAVNAISSNFGPTRIYNLGINTLAQVPVTAYGIHFNRHGLLPAQDDNTKYFAVVTNNNENGNNRLESLQTKFQLGVKYSNTNFINNPLITRTQRLLRTLNPIARSIGGLIGGRVGRAINNVSRLSSLFFNNNNLIIDNYLGGPGSTYGVGKTLIRRYDITENGQRIDSAFEKSNTVARNAKVDFTTSLSIKGPTANIEGDGFTTIIATNVENQNVIKGLSISPPLKKYTDIQDAVNKQKNYTQTLPSSSYAVEKNTNIKYEFKSNPNIIIGKGNTTNKFRYNEDVETNFNRIDSNILQIIFRIQNPFSGLEDQINLSAYMNGFKDNFTATWNDINYAGRAESFYVYNKFKRDVSFNLQIPCFNEQQLYEKHRALGQLAATTAGSYNNNGFLGGVLIKLDVGNYIVGEYTILDSISYNIPDNTTWDIDAKLAMNLEASFQFKIIHKDLPEYKPTIPQKDPGKGFFNYLPNTFNTFITERNRPQSESDVIARNFASTP